MPKTELAPTKPAKSSPGVQLNTYPFWSPRFWHGMRLGDWWKLLSTHRFRVHPLRIPMALIVTQVSTVNSLLSRISQWKYGKAVDDTSLEQPPLFIIGHWRSGTTYLHELMVRDPAMGFPNTYECFAPHHFLLTGWFFPPLLRFLLPSKRPMDNMPAGFDLPQEDEFAMCALGAPTPYYRMAFPYHTPPYMEFLDMEGVEPHDLQRWKEALTYFVRALTYAKGKRIVLKSPPHTGRIQVLAEMFPGARFVHIVRDPLDIFASTRRLWPALDAAQSFQWPPPRDVDEYVFTAFERMYAGFEKQRPHLDPSQICDVRYEELIRDPLGQLDSIYRKLDLGDFETVRPAIAEFVQSRKDYSPNRNALEPEIQREVRRRWAGYFERYGYELPPITQSAAG